MTPEDLVEPLKAILGSNLRSIVLYGSAVTADFHPEKSDYNLMLVVDRLGVSELNALSRLSCRWAKAGNRPPLLFTRGQLQASADVFPVEILDIQQSHRVLFGGDPLADVAVNHHQLRLQLKREFSGKLLALRERYLLTGGRPKRVAAVLTSSIGGFLVLFRAALRLFNKDVPAGKVDALRLLAGRISLDPQPLLEILELKLGRRKISAISQQVLFDSYLKTIEQAAKALDSQVNP